MKSLFELHGPRPSGAEEDRARRDIIKKAISTALKGNATLYNNALDMALGRTKVARAYKAAFACVPRPAKFPYRGKLTSEIEVQIAGEAERLSVEFCAAYRAAMDRM
jgi:hypothetical protein